MCYNYLHMLTKDDLKAILDTISPYIDARARTTETLMKGEINSSEERQAKRLAKAKEELEAEILASRAAAKVESATLQAKVVKRINQLDERVEELEKEADIPHLFLAIIFRLILTLSELACLDRSSVV